MWELSAEELRLLNYSVGKDSLESLGLQGDWTSQSWRKSVLNIHWKDWCWSWNSNTLATWCKELTHLKRPWCWERLKVGEGDNRGWDGWMALLTQWTWVWVNFGSWWWAGRPGLLWSMGSQRVRHDLATELNHVKNWLIGQDPDAGKYWVQEKGTTRGWNAWMASPTQWTWVWVNSRSWWWAGRPGLLWFMESQRVGHDWAIELNWWYWSSWHLESLC